MMNEHVYVLSQLYLLPLQESFTINCCTFKL